MSSTDPYGSLTASLFSAFRQKAAPAETPSVKHTFKAIAAQDGVIVGIGSYAELVDLDNDVVRKSDLVKMAYDFCANKDRKFKANHKNDIDCDLVASWPGAPVLKSGKVLRDGEPIPADDPVVAISLEKGSETAWFLAVRPHDKSIADLAEKGEVAGFSWAGPASRTLIKE